MNTVYEFQYCKTPQVNIFFIFICGMIFLMLGIKLIEFDSFFTSLFCGIGMFVLWSVLNKLYSGVQSTKEKNKVLKLVVKDKELIWEEIVNGKTLLNKSFSQVEVLNMKKEIKKNRHGSYLSLEISNSQVLLEDSKFEFFLGQEQAEEVVKIINNFSLKSNF